MREGTENYRQAGQHAQRQSLSIIGAGEKQGVAEWRNFKGVESKREQGNAEDRQGGGGHGGRC